MADNTKLRAGFSRVKITPPVGTAMSGFGQRDADPTGCRGIHDDLYVRALSLTQGETEVLIMGFDLLFFSRDEADRYKGALGRALDLSPNQMLLNTSHTHTGPKVGTWIYTPSDTHYLDYLELRILEAATEARTHSSEATLWAGCTRADLPLSRRMRDESGKVYWGVNPQGEVYDKVPFCLLKDSQGHPLSLLFSASCHPSTDS